MWRSKLVPSFIIKKPIKTQCIDQLVQIKEHVAEKDLIKIWKIELLKATEILYHLSLQISRDLLLTALPYISHVTGWTARSLRKANIFLYLFKSLLSWLQSPVLQNQMPFI